MRGRVGALGARDEEAFEGFEEKECKGWVEGEDQGGGVAGPEAQKALFGMDAERYGLY